MLKFRSLSGVLCILFLFTPWQIISQENIQKYLIIVYCSCANGPEDYQKIYDAPYIWKPQNIFENYCILKLASWLVATRPASIVY